MKQAITAAELQSLVRVTRRLPLLILRPVEILYGIQIVVLILKCDLRDVILGLEGSRRMKRCECRVTRRLQKWAAFRSFSLCCCSWRTKVISFYILGIHREATFKLEHFANTSSRTCMDLMRWHCTCLRWGPFAFNAAILLRTLKSQP